MFERHNNKSKIAWVKGRWIPSNELSMSEFQEIEEGILQQERDFGAMLRFQRDLDGRL